MIVKQKTGWLGLVKGIILSTATAALVSGCQDLKDIQQLDPLKGVVFKINYEPAPTTLQGLVIDAKTVEPLKVPVQISIFGPDASRVITYEGLATTTFVSAKADLFIGLKGSIPSAAKPAELRIVVDAPGYISSSIYLFVDQAKPAPFEIRLVKETTTPSGVIVKQDVVETSATGNVKSNESITTPIDASMANHVTLSIPAGTQLKDVKGQPVVGNLSTQVAAYSSQTEAALRTFPGGFTTRIKGDDQGNANVKGTFTTAGFVSIEIANSSSQKVTTFSQPVMVNVEVATSLINPETGQKIKSGDPIPVFSYAENTGEWTYERDVAVKQEGSSLQVTIPITHLSGYSLAFWTPSGTSCTAGGQWAITGKPDGKPVNWILYNGNQQYIANGSTSDNSIVFSQLTSGAAQLNLFSPDGKLIGTSTVNSICGNHTVSVTYPQNLVDLIVSVTASCENKPDLQISPSAWARYRKVGTSNWQQSFCTAGQGKLVGLEPSTDYEVGVDYNGFNSIVVNSGQTTSNKSIEIKLTNAISICQ
ncbi:hypothetical protein [Spirosoma flavum]|uniref:Uncharacterized protein n=1 Tax=Spirosoma flavum TaxID=2048557 RepID=A0ABW6ADG9_9BACT